MRNIFLILFILSLSYCSVRAQITFQKRIFKGNSSGTSALQTSDGGYILIGDTDSLASVNDDMLLIKVNNHGETEWAKTIGTNDVCGASGMIETSDGGFAICGYTDDSGGAQRDVYLVRTDNMGNVIWSKRYGANNSENGKDVLQTIDGGFIITGRGQSNLITYLVRTNGNGDLIWSKTIGASNYQDGHSIQQASDGGFIIAGNKKTFTYQDDVCLTKTDSLGNLQWIKTYGSTGNEVGYDVGLTLDGGYIIAGSGFGGTLLIKTDSIGNLQWAKVFEESIGNSVQQTLDGGFAVASTANLSGNDDDVFLIKTDVNGNLQWSRLFGGPGSEHGKSVQQTTDGGYILAGESYNSNTYLIKTDSLGNTGCNESIPTVSTLIPTLLVSSPPVIVSVYGSESSVTSTVGGGVTSSFICSSCQPCPIPINLNTNNITSVSAQLMWDITACAVSYKVKYRPYGSPTWTTKSVNGNSGFKNIAGLAPNTQYQWRVRSKCSSNPNVWSAWSGNSFFTTPLRVGELAEEEITFNIYPNPATDQLNVSFGNLEIENLEIVNQLGQIVYSQNPINQIDVSALPAGVYFLTAYSNKQQVTKMLVKE